MASRVDELVQQLDGGAEEPMDARAELIHIGRSAVPAIIEGLPSLGSFGRMTAIEVFEALRDVRCGPALIGLPTIPGPEMAPQMPGSRPEGALPSF
uniref:Uncharacterized protein n=1 Tax=Streptomyces sp. NBC_00008 TaxID=2903610 RepID=A0AAU2VPX6_9ACTN